MTCPISVIIITKNEERNIERCLASVSFADEVLVVDSGSQDLTVKLAEKSGAKVLFREWMGFGPQKKWATSQAKHDWILSIDADEVVSAELASEIQRKFMELDPKTGYEMPRKSWFMDRWILHGGWYPDRQLRLYHRKHSDWPEAIIHERVIPSSGQIEIFKSPLYHYVFKNIGDQIETNNRYSGLLAQADFEKGKRFSILKMLLKPGFKFLECYFLKLGFLDGFAGYVIARNAGYSIFLRTVKLREVEQINKGSR